MLKYNLNNVIDIKIIMIYNYIIMSLDKLINRINIMDINYDYNKTDIDNKLYKYLKYNINLDKNDYDKLICDNIDKKYIDNRIELLNKYRKQLRILKCKPYFKQKTKEWLDLRKTCLTASDLHDALNKNNLLLAKKKAGVFIDNIIYHSIPPLKWGTMFEDMAQRCYSQKNNIDVHEFGLLNNEKISHFGASPDGITDIGIMVEIKCPYSRKIKENFIPEKYYYQIQGQLAVCELNECDYIECDFKIIDTDYEYIDYVNENNLGKKNHGIIAEYFDNIADEYYYIYSDALLTAEETIVNINKQMLLQDNKDKKFCKLSRWVLNEMYIQRVFYNEKLWHDILPKIKEFWDKVNDCRQLPIEYKKIKPKKFNFVPE